MKIKFITFSIISILAIMLLPLISRADNLFDYETPQTTALLENSRGVFSRHLIKFNKEALKNNINFKLPSGKTIRIRLENRKKTQSKVGYATTNYRGYVKEKSRRQGTFQLAVTEDGKGGQAINGMLRTNGGEVYLMKQSHDGSKQELLRINEAEQVECVHSPDMHPEINRDPAKTTNDGVGIKTDVTIGVLVAYTPDAIATAGSEAALQSLIQTMVSNANLSHANSHTGVTYSLLAMHKLSADSTDNFGNDLSAATNPSDGKWDELDSLREEYCADQVSVIVGGTNGQTICGIAWLGGDASNMPYYKDSMYSIISANQSICSYLTFTHELAHNLGSAHDYENSGSQRTAAYNYSYGHRFTGNSSQQYRTVMAYAPGTRIPYFSNPSITYDGAATGTSSANNAASLALTSPIVAAFYGDGATCGNHSPLPVISPTPGNPGPPSSPTTLPITAADTIKLSGKTANKITNFRVQVSGAGIGIGGVPITVYYDKTGFGGFVTPYLSGKTNSKGTKKFSKKRRKGYYMACYSSLCSGANKY